MEINNNDITFLKGKRLAGIDFGLKRTAIAVSDELHIAITPKKVFNTESENFINEIIEFILNQNIAAIVVGIPFREDKKKTDVIIAIEKFIDSLKKNIKIPIFIIDESYSTVRASETMVNIGKSKKQRRIKTNKDLIAAGIILKSFIDEYDL